MDDSHEQRSTIPNTTDNNIPKLSMSQKSKTIGSVQRAIDILNLFEPQSPELGTTDIARAMNLAKSTVAGLIYTLERNGYLEQNPANRKYRLGYKIAERTGVFLQQFDLRQIAVPILERLRDECQESVNLAVLDGTNVIYIERMHGTNTLGMRSEIGKREKIHSTALGKAILASLPKLEVDKIIENYDFVPITHRTITSKAALTSELETIRQRGYAIDDQENELGGRCVASALTNFRNDPIAAISISVPIQRLPNDRITEFGRKVRSAAAEISTKLGAREKDYA